MPSVLFVPRSWAISGKHACLSNKASDVAHRHHMSALHQRLVNERVDQIILADLSFNYDQYWT